MAEFVSSNSILVCETCKKIHYLRTAYFAGEATEKRTPPSINWLRIECNLILKHTNPTKWGYHEPGKMSPTEEKMYDAMSIIVFKDWKHKDHRMKLLRIGDEVPQDYAVELSYTLIDFNQYRTDNPERTPHYEDGNLKDL